MNRIVVITIVVMVRVNNTECVGEEDSTAKVYGEPASSRTVCNAATGRNVCRELGRRLRV